MALWDDATQAYTGQQPQQDSGSLWGWLTSLFSGRPSTPAQPTRPSGSAATPAIDMSWNANPWTNMQGVPASMQVAPPSMYTAGNPQQQAAWQQASNPIGYAAMTQPSATAAATDPAAVPVRTPPAAMMPPPPKPMPPPVIQGTGNIMPPAGGSTGWPGGMGMMPPGYGPAAPPPSLIAPSAGRNLSDAELEKMNYGDIERVVDRTDLTSADRIAILNRLSRM